MSNFTEAKAKVVKVDNDYIYVQKILDNAGCENCSSLCNKRDTVIKLKNSDGYNVNDILLIRTNDKEILIRAMVLYGTPILSILVTVLIAKYLLQLPDMLSAILSILSIPIAYIILRKTYKSNESIKIERFGEDK